MHKIICICFENSQWAQSAADCLYSPERVVTEIRPGAQNLSRPDLLIFEYARNTAACTLEWIRNWRRASGSFPVLAVVFESSEEHAIQALKAGINDYLVRPSSPTEIRRAAEGLLKDRLDSPTPALIGDSSPMRLTREQVRRASLSEANVLVTGETGTGKELVAEAIHRGSRRSSRPFLCVNCAAIPDELFESELFGYEKGAFTGAHTAREGKLKLAEGGTLFLDEVGDLSHYAQAKILRIIDSREVWPLGARRPIRVNSRIIAATNRDLAGMTRNNTFRLDLFYRLDVARIQVPPLRERAADVPALLGHFLKMLSTREPGDVEEFDAQATDALQRYSWPGNVRELRNVVEGLLVNMPPKTIGIDTLPAHLRTAVLEQASEEDRSRLMEALTSTNWNVSQVARKMNWSRMTVYRKMARYHVVKSRPGASERN